MMTKTNPSGSASTTGSLGPAPADPAVVALTERLHSRDANDHASFIKTLYGTESELFANPTPLECCDGANVVAPGGKTFAEVIQLGWRQFHNRTLSRQRVNESLEPSSFGRVSFGTAGGSRSVLGKLHTGQEGVPESIESWGGLVNHDLSAVLKDAFEGEYGSWLGPEQLRNWPLHDEQEHATMTWKTTFNLLSPDEPTDILEPGQSLPAPPPRYIWRGSYERVDNIGKAMHDAIDSALQGPQPIPGGNTWGKRTIYRLEPSYDTERGFENCLSKESEQFLDRVERSMDLCDLVLSAFNLGAYIGVPRPVRCSTAHAVFGRLTVSGRITT